MGYDQGRVIALDASKIDGLTRRLDLSPRSAAKAVGAMLRGDDLLNCFRKTQEADLDSWSSWNGSRPTVSDRRPPSRPSSARRRIAPKSTDPRATYEQAEDIPKVAQNARDTLHRMRADVQKRCNRRAHTWTRPPVEYDTTAAQKPRSQLPPRGFQPPPRGNSQGAQAKCKQGEAERKERLHAIWMNALHEPPELKRKSTPAPVGNTNFQARR